MSRITSYYQRSLIVLADACISFAKNTGIRNGWRTACQALSAWIERPCTDFPMVPVFPNTVPRSRQLPCARFGTVNVVCRQAEACADSLRTTMIFPSLLFVHESPCYAIKFIARKEHDPTVKHPSLVVNGRETSTTQQHVCRRFAGTTAPRYGYATSSCQVTLHASPSSAKLSAGNIGRHQRTRDT